MAVGVTTFPGDPGSAAPEAQIVAELAERIGLDPARRAAVEQYAACIAQAVRDQETRDPLTQVLSEYGLESEDGVIVLCLAEALNRVADPATQSALLEDLLARGHWERHLGHGEALFANAATWGLLLTGRIVRLAHDEAAGRFKTILARAGVPWLRRALVTALELVGGHFVLGETIGEALRRSVPTWLYSYDMLGEATLTATAAERQWQAYLNAVMAISGAYVPGDDPWSAPGISLKLSALHPRFDYTQRTRVLAELLPRLRALVEGCRERGVLCTIDAEEAERLDLTLEVYAALLAEMAGDDRPAPGLAVQSYRRDALPLIAWLESLARERHCVIPVRLVKGAYWDAEIKRAQVLGLEAYPVFTRKSHTDVSFLACARRLFEATPHLYPQFATHNVHSACAVLELAGGRRFEFQRLHGMGGALYEALRAARPDIPCRVYAPVGPRRELVPYLLRRLLENGANTSFLHHLAQRRLPIAEMVRDPVEAARAHAFAPQPKIPLPPDLYRPGRSNAPGLDLAVTDVRDRLLKQMHQAGQTEYRSQPWINGTAWPARARRPVHDPADRRRVVGLVEEADPELTARAVQAAHAGFEAWSHTEAEQRAVILERVAEAYLQHRAVLMGLLVREGGRTLPNALAEWREAVDYCRYYAMLARAQLAEPQSLPGPAGEKNALALAGRGVFACISPWNFPLAIFTGQIAAALAAGNTVVAKPAEQTPLIARQAVQLMHQAGVPAAALQLLPGNGDIGAALVAQPGIAGVLFTGGTATARQIARALAAKDGPLVPLIAETGGINAMIADASALPEQLVRDVLSSAFDSAGQRCSALRVLFLQTEIADDILAEIAGAMAELSIGDPFAWSTDIGPIIDDEARDRLERYVERLPTRARLVYRCALPDACRQGCFFPPQVWELERLSLPQEEIFGPVLHVVRYARDELPAVLDSIAETGYGLTLGIHSRVPSTVDYIQRRARVGNVYVNRNMIGAVVGVQPFGGEGLSGTGPKAGGPNLLRALCTERTYCTNTAAVGGSTELLNLE